eukprot:SAG31_NODE_31201_length_371_cov_0.485294_1_plen_21_part_01
MYARELYGIEVMKYDCTRIAI